MKPNFLESDDVSISELTNSELYSEDTQKIMNQINYNRIKKLTKQKIKKNQRTHIYSKWSPVKAAAIIFFIICISGSAVFAAANPELRQNISNLLNINQSEILSIGQSIQGKDYELTVHEIASDSYIGHIIISMEALSEKAKQSYKTSPPYKQLESIGYMGYAIGELEEIKENYKKYYIISFSSTRDYELEDGLTFKLKGIHKKIHISIPQTISYKELEIKVPSTDTYAPSFFNMRYSELGFMLYGTLENKEVYTENADIKFEMNDGSVINFYHNYYPYKEMTFNSEKPETNNLNLDTQIETAPTVESDFTDYENNSSEEWFSGCTISTGNDSSMISSYTFAKKMNWSNVKSIIINDTIVNMP